MNATAFYCESLMGQESTEIARGLRRRDPDLLDRLIEQYQHRLLRYLVYLTGHRELAEDLFQETWIRVLERGHQFNDKYAFGTWLFAVARNLAIDHLRRKQPASLDGLLNDDDARFDVPATGQASAFDLTLQREQNQHQWRGPRRKVAAASVGSHARASHTASWPISTRNQSGWWTLPLRSAEKTQVCSPRRPWSSGQSEY